MDAMSKIYKEQSSQVHLVEGLELHSKFITPICRSSCWWAMFRSLIFPLHSKPGLKRLRMQKSMKKELQGPGLKHNLKPRPKHRLKLNSGPNRHKLQQASVYQTLKKIFWVCGNQLLFSACQWMEAQFFSSSHQTLFHTTVAVILSSFNTLQMRLQRRFRSVRTSQLRILVRSMMMGCMWTGWEGWWGMRFLLLEENSGLGWVMRLETSYMSWRKLSRLLRPQHLPLTIMPTPQQTMQGLLQLSQVQHQPQLKPHFQV